MARLTGALLSLGASGQIAKTLVAGKWKGRPYMRQYVVPSNPNSVAQQETRNTFKFLNALYRYIPAGALGAWTLKAKNNQVAPRNSFLADNVGVLREQANLDLLTLSPAAGGGIPAAGFVVTPGNDQVQLVLTAPTLPAGWSIVKAHFAAVRDQDPQSGTLYDVSYDDDDAAPYDVTLTGLASAQTYQVRGWFEYLNSAGDTVYGINSADTALTT